MFLNNTEELVDYEAYLNSVSCDILYDLPYEERCDYISQEPHCNHFISQVDYMSYLYCTLRPQNKWVHYLCLQYMSFLMIVIFFLLNIVADEFFCPLLRLFGNRLGMNEHLAAVTLLAFGNSATGLFFTILNLEDTSQLYYNNLSGTCMVSLSFVAGMVCVLAPFQILGSSFCIDALFFLSGNLIIDHVIRDDGGIDIMESAVILAHYFLYVSTIIIDHWLLRRHLRNMEINYLNPQGARMPTLAELNVLRGQTVLGLTTLIGNERKTINPDRTRLRKYNEMAGNNDHLFVDFLHYMQPIDLVNWPDMDTAENIMHIIRAPAVTILKIFIPLYNYELPKHGWCKLINCCQIVYMPIVLIFICAPKSHIIIDYAYAVLLLVTTITLPLAIVGFWFSRVDVPPKFHSIFGLYGGAAAIVVIYVCAKEACGLLLVIGKVIRCSPAFMGCIFTALGLSYGEIVANLSMARKGYQRMALSACFGGSILNSHLTFGLAMLYNSIKSETGQVKINIGPLNANAMFFLVILNLSTLFMVVSANFNGRRVVGIYLLLVYLIFVLYAVLVECEVISSWTQQADKWI